MSFLLSVMIQKNAELKAINPEMYNERYGEGTQYYEMEKERKEREKERKQDFEERFSRD